MPVKLPRPRPRGRWVYPPGPALGWPLFWVLPRIVPGSGSGAGPGSGSGAGPGSGSGAGPRLGVPVALHLGAGNGRLHGRLLRGAEELVADVADGQTYTPERAGLLRLVVVLTIGGPLRLTRVAVLAVADVRGWVLSGTRVLSFPAPAALGVSGSMVEVRDA